MRRSNTARPAAWAIRQPLAPKRRRAWPRYQRQRGGDAVAGAVADHPPRHRERLEPQLAGPVGGVDLGDGRGRAQVKGSLAMSVSSWSRVRSAGGVRKHLSSTTSDYHQTELGYRGQDAHLFLPLLRHLLILDGPLVATRSSGPATDPVRQRRPIGRDRLARSRQKPGLTAISDGKGGCRHRRGRSGEQSNDDRPGAPAHLPTRPRSSAQATTATSSQLSVRRQPRGLLIARFMLLSRYDRARLVPAPTVSA